MQILTNLCLCRWHWFDH